MNAAQPSLSLDRCDLLPPLFRYQNRVRQVCCSWLTVVCALVAILCGVTAATILRTHGERRRCQQIASTAIPLIDLRQNVLHMQQQNDQRDQWCRQVDAARPADGVLQTLAAVTVASQTEDQAILIDSLRLRLPIEFPASAPNTPPWAIPQIEIHARIMAGAQQPWLDRLNSFDRIDAAAIDSTAVSDRNTPPPVQSHSISTTSQPIQVTATPTSTRVLP